jgi:ribonuclease BN (tRNA processing enzyme)
MARAYDLPPEEGMHGEFEFLDHVAVTEVGPFRITSARVNHPVEAYGVRVEAGGRTLVFSGDTAESDALVELARGADLALFEASFLESGDNPAGLHLTARGAAEHALRADVGALVLTHLVPWNRREDTEAEAVAAYAGGTLHLAEQGLTLEV